MPRAVWVGGCHVLCGWAGVTCCVGGRVPRAMWVGGCHVPCEWAGATCCVGGGYHVGHGCVPCGIVTSSGRGMCHVPLDSLVLPAMFFFFAHPAIMCHVPLDALVHPASQTAADALDLMAHGYPINTAKGLPGASCATDSNVADPSSLHPQPQALVQHGGGAHADAAILLGAMATAHAPPELAVKEKKAKAGSGGQGRGGAGGRRSGSSKASGRGRGAGTSKRGGGKVSESYLGCLCV